MWEEVTIASLATAAVILGTQWVRQSRRTRRAQEAAAQVSRERTGLAERHSLLQAERDALAAERDAVSREVSGLAERHSLLQHEHATLRQEHDALSREHQSYDAEEHRMLDFLHEISESLYEDTSPRKLHRRIIRGVSAVVEARGGALYLLDAGRRQLVPASITKECPPLIELPADMLPNVGRRPSQIRSYLSLQSIGEGEGALGEALQRGKPVKYEDLLQHASFAAAPSIGGRKLAVMIAPLLYGPKKLGVMAVARPASSGAPFTAHDFDVFKSLAEQSAFALGNSMVHQEALEKRRIEDELQRASQIQRVLLPSKPPEIEGFSLAAAYQPAKVISGDYYDFIRLDETHVGIVIADVSGKGISAGLVMATCRSFMRVCSAQSLSPVEVLSRVNRLIFGDIREDMFVSLAYCIIDTASGEVTLARAGHDPPLLFRRTDGRVEPVKPPGLALGVDKGAVFDRATREMTLTLAPGDCLLLYTDGVTEALDKAGLDEYGLPRLSAAFQSGASGGAGTTAVLDGIQENLADFVTGARQHDDITLVLIERLR